jgi:hypothetical protein
LVLPWDLQEVTVLIPFGPYFLRETSHALYCLQPILPKLPSLGIAISTENPHLGNSCLTTLTKSSPDPVEAGMERRLGD